MLTDVKIRKTKPGSKTVKIADGGGLHLQVTPAGGKYWRLAYRWHGKQKTLALGVYPTVSLADARRARDEAKAALTAGEDPAAKKREAKRRAKRRAADSFAARREILAGRSANASNTAATSALCPTRLWQRGESVVSSNLPQACANLILR